MEFFSIRAKPFLRLLAMRMTMSISPAELMKIDRRSAETFFDWFTRIAKVDFLGGEPDDLRRFLNSRTQRFFRNLNDEYWEHHQKYPGGFSLPPLKGRRPLLWDVGVGWGGVDYRTAFFGPLAYEGIAFTDGIRWPTQLILGKTKDEISGSAAHNQFLAFMDLLIDYAPLFRTGQLSVISEKAAYGIANPRDEYEDTWRCHDIEQDLMGRDDVDSRNAIARMPTIVGYHNLAAAFDADPIIEDEEVAAASAVLYDYVGLLGYADSRDAAAYATEMMPSFNFYFDTRMQPRSLRERAELISLMTDSEYWRDVRSSLSRAMATNTLADYQKSLGDALDDINRREGEKPPLIALIGSEYAANLPGSVVSVGALGLAGYLGFPAIETQINNNPYYSMLFGAAAATAANITITNVKLRYEPRTVRPADITRLMRHSVLDPRERFETEEEKRAYDLRISRMKSSLQRRG
ncbi:hypothetical protein [Paracoccus homiensis]|uniref:hypothetical protein n=1 Tax=Paracoccus homiensis TaxID=364199 RepID=UPI00398CD337